MNYPEAINEVRNGNNVRLPEWRGYWFRDDRGAIMALTKDGDVREAWGDSSAVNEREDWEIAEGLDFGWVVSALKAGKKVTRTGWNGKGMWLALQVPDGHSKMSLPYIYMKTADGNQVPWLASQTDMLSEDWQLFNS